MRRIGVAIAALVLVLGATGARAGAAVPVEGSWGGESSDGLPVHFGVAGGQIFNPHFKFDWGFCGTYDSHLPYTTAPVDAGGHWVIEDSRGQTIEGTFTAPNRVEGTIVTLSRMTPSCPHTEATFTAAPVPTNPESFAAAREGIEALPYEISLRGIGTQSAIVGTVRGSLGERFRFYLFVNRSAPRRLEGEPTYDPHRLRGGKLANTDALLVTPPRRGESKAQRRERRRILGAVADSVCLRQTDKRCPN